MGFNTNLNTNVWNYNTNRVNQNTQPTAGLVQNPKPNPKPSIFQPILYPSPIKNPYPGLPGPIGGAVDPGTLKPDKYKPNPNPYPICGMVPNPAPTLVPKPTITPVPTNEPKPLGGSVYIPREKY